MTEQPQPSPHLVLGIEAYADGEVVPGEHVCDYDHDPDAACPGASTDEGEKL